MKSSTLVPLFAALLGGVITASTSLFISMKQAKNFLQQEKEQFESQLILSAINPDSLQKSKSNITKLVEAGFISSSNKIVKKLNENDSLYELYLSPPGTATGTTPVGRGFGTTPFKTGKSPN